MLLLALKMEGATGKDQRADQPTTSKKVGTSVLQPQELGFANNLNDLGSGFFPQTLLWIPYEPKPRHTFISA